MKHVVSTLIKLTIIMLMPGSLILKAEAPSQPGVQSVCGALNIAPDVLPVLIRVRGFLDGSPMHGYVLKQSVRDDPCAEARSEFRSAPSVVLLVWKGGYGVSLSESEKKENNAIFSDLVARFQRRDIAPRPFLVLGKLVLKRNPGIVRMPNGGYSGNGFGDMGAFPAILIVRSARPE